MSNNSRGLSLIFLILSMSSVQAAYADDYTWHSRSQEDDERRLLPEDPNICQLYETNLKYFARKNTPMSCYRPIAPQFRDRIQDVSWENLDPERYPELFKAIVKDADNVQLNDLGFAAWKKRVESGEIVFRRAKTPPLKGHPRRMDSEPEPYWIVQYGVNYISTTNPDEFSRCKPRRGGMDRSESLGFYIASFSLNELITRLPSDVVNPNHKGEYLRVIDERLFIENMYSRGISLNEVDTDLGLADPICSFLFKKTPVRRK